MSQIPANSQSFFRQTWTTTATLPWWQVVVVEGLSLGYLKIGAIARNQTYIVNLNVTGYLPYFSGNLNHHQPPWPWWKVVVT